MTEAHNRKQKRQAEAIARKTAKPSRTLYENLEAEVNRLTMMQNAYVLHQQKKGANGNQRRLIVPLDMEPPTMITLAYSKIVVSLSVRESSIVELGRHHLCEYTKPVALGSGEPREAVVLFSLRNRQDELNRAMAALKQYRRR